MIQKHHHDIELVEIAPRAETRFLLKANTMLLGARDARALSSTCGCSDTEKWICFSRLNFGPPYPAKFKQTIQQSSKKVKSRIIITFNYDVGAKTAEALSN